MNRKLAALLIALPLGVVSLTKSASAAEYHPRPAQNPIEVQAQRPSIDRDQATRREQAQRDRLQREQAARRAQIEREQAARRDQPQRDQVGRR